MADDVLTLAEAAKVMRVSLRTAERMIAKDEMPGAVRIRGMWRVSRRRLDEHMHGKAQVAS